MSKIAKDYEGKLPGKLIEEVLQSVPDKITDAKLKKVFDAVVTEYENAKVSAGESVGIIGAESIGEQGTQMTLNTFHFTGVSEMSVTTGLPRIIEIADARKTLSTPSMEVQLQEPYCNGEGIKEFAQSLKATTLQEMSTKFELNLEQATIDVFLDKKQLEVYNKKPADILATMKKLFKGQTVKEKDAVITVKAKSKEADVVSLYALQEKVKKAFVSGIKNVTHVLPVKREDKYVIVTAGSNLKEILKVEGVDVYNTYTNDFYEVEKILGIEAARQLIINEMTTVVEAQGLDVDVRHIMLVADTMCVGGTVKGVTRYGVVSEKSSVLARASFETPLKHLIVIFNELRSKSFSFRSS